LYDKQSILEYIITKKNEGSRKMKEFEKQKRTETEELAALAQAERNDQVKKFVKQESNIILPSSLNQKSRHWLSCHVFCNSFFVCMAIVATSPSLYSCMLTENQDGPSISNMAPGKEHNVPSFWIPSKTPQAKKSEMTKPVSLCLTYSPKEASTSTWVRSKVEVET
jgi:nitric oxide synthase-interacting protein